MNVFFILILYIYSNKINFAGSWHSDWWPYAHTDKLDTQEKQICEEDSTFWGYDPANRVDRLGEY